MTLSPGTRLGAYEVLAPLGAGGMGEVYRGRDTRLGREVALKVLPEALAADRDRLSRFEQEARAASALNHPNIVTIHDIGREGETAFIAMELIDGKTLRELSASGPMPVKKILNLAAQVCEGLSKAHAAGIVHRDLKPENVMVSKDGFVKILDFGLAKLVETESGAVSVMPTLAQQETRPGTVMGTVGYMSPEQASGEPLDFRSDQFSLGSILYEIVTGKKAFQRRTAAETMSAIIREEPEPVATLRPDLPMPVRWILERCLAKDREERYASTRDLARDLASLRDHLSEVSSGAEALLSAPGVSRRRAIPLAVAIALAAVALAAGWAVARGFSKRLVSAPSFKRLTFQQGSIGNARFAPDGQTIVYGAVWQGSTNKMRLYLTRAESPESKSFDFLGDILSISRTGELAVQLPRPLPPYDRGTLATVPMAGGAPRPILENVNYAGADWAPDGKGLAVAHVAEGKSRLEFPIGTVLVPDNVDTPRFSPDGESISFWERSGGAQSITVIDRLGKSKRALTSGWAGSAGVPCWTSDNREIWFTAAKAGERPALWAVDRSGKVRLLTRTPGFLELDDVSRDGRALLAHHTPIATLRGRAPGAPKELELSWLDWSWPSDLSPDGKTLVLTERGEAAGASKVIYLRGTDGSPALRLAQGEGIALSPDKRWVLADIAAGAGKKERRVLLPTGPGEPKELAMEKLDPGWGAFTPDGKHIVFAATGPDGKSRLYIQEIAVGKPRAISDDGVGIQGLTSPVSPDGRFVVGFRGAQCLLYPLDGSGQARAVTGILEGDRVIQWSADSRSLYVYRMSEPQVWLVDMQTGQRRLWKELSLGDSIRNLRVRVTPDGAAYVYAGMARFSGLYLVEGLR